MTKQDFRQRTRRVVSQADWSQLAGPLPLLLSIQRDPIVGTLLVLLACQALLAHPEIINTTPTIKHVERRLNNLATDFIPRLNTLQSHLVCQHLGG